MPSFARAITDGAGHHHQLQHHNYNHILQQHESSSFPCPDHKPTKSRTSPGNLLSRIAATASRHGGDSREVHSAMDYYERKSTSSSTRSASTAPLPLPPTTDSSKKRDSHSGLPPPLTKEEFEALPVAVQRKYFSTLERLRFAQLDGPFDNTTDHSVDSPRRNKDRSVTDNLCSKIRRHPPPRLVTTPEPDPLLFAHNLPEKIRRREFTREEQVVLARHFRTSVILDAADEAIYKARRVSRNLSLDSGDVDAAALGAFLKSPSVVDLPSPRNMPAAMDRAPSLTRQQPPSRLPPRAETPSAVPDSFYDSFRCLDDAEDLDLRLMLDDYHANLRESLPSPKHDGNRPSFRRHLSITKLPFGRPSVSSSRPATKDASTPSSPLHNPPDFAANVYQTPRRRSRTLSLISAKQHREPVFDAATPIDPDATHYQDPEARLKLRVYLASPQKFDEAIEFGFPSVEALSGGASDFPRDQLAVRKRQSRHIHMPEPQVTAGMETFFTDADDDDEITPMDTSDHGSLPDPDSPRTPLSALEKPPATSAGRRMVSDNYAQLPAASREMTLRMTLTRPDLRAADEKMYGCRQPVQHVRRSQSAALRDDHIFPPSTTDGPYRESADRSLTGPDHWGPPADQNVMKRIWNRVRRS